MDGVRSWILTGGLYILCPLFEAVVEPAGLQTPPAALRILPSGREDQVRFKHPFPILDEEALPQGI
ncbi:MAG: hypothetical protein E4G99_12905 [Anaerolineales bacterium]|nr:MAG: hypothetical protein E4G99_12905 [Anaerolineales bacterium]